MKRFLFALGLFSSASFAYADTRISPFVLWHQTNTWYKSQVFESSPTFKNSKVGIRGVEYTWPTSIGSGGCLKVDGSGNVTAESCGGGGGGGSGTSTGTLRQLGYDYVIGSTGATNVDMVVSSAGGFRTMLAKLGAHGLTFSNDTATARVFLTTGVYEWTGVTVPARVQLFCAPGSSTVIRNISSTVEMMNVYGYPGMVSIEGCTFDGGGTEHTHKGVNLKGYARLKDVYASNWRPATQNTTRACSFCSFNTSNTYIDGLKFLDMVKGNRGATIPGESAPFQIYGSSDVFYSGILISSFTMDAPSGTNGTLFSFMLSSRVHLTDSTFFQSGGDFIVIGNQISNLTIARNKFYMTHPAASVGYINSQRSASAPGRLVGGDWRIKDNEFIVALTGAGTAGTIIYFDNQSNIHSTIEGNYLTQANSNATIILFINISGADVTGTMIRNNTQLTLIGGFITDSGTGTQMTGNDNFRSGTEQ